MYDDEVVGMKALERLASDVYGDENPAAMMYDETPMQFVRHDDSCELLLKLPFANPEEIDSWVSGDELFIQIGNQRKIITLPVTLAGIEPDDAKFKGQWLSIHFSLQGAVAKAV